MNKQELMDYFKSKRFIIIMVVLITMWLLLMLFFYLKADEITKHPCAICSAKVGTDIVCSTYDGSSQMIFHPDFTIDKINSGGS